MALLNFNYNHSLFDKTIQLYGDRAGGQGNFEFAGLAEIQDIKLILIEGNTQSLLQAADWRRLHRLINLAKRLTKPIILWNLPLLHIASTQRHASLALSTAIQNVNIQILKVQQTIITVFDGNHQLKNLVQEVGWADGSVIVTTEKMKISKSTNLQHHNLKIVTEQKDIPNQIIDLLKIIQKTPIDDLITKRFGV